MSGLVKAKKYDWKDSNMALFGSETEKKIKQESAETEEAWNGAGAKEGLQIWRINNFKVRLINFFRVLFKYDSWGVIFSIFC